MCPPHITTTHMCPPWLSIAVIKHSDHSCGGVVVLVMMVVMMSVVMTAVMMAVLMVVMMVLMS